MIGFRAMLTRLLRLGAYLEKLEIIGTLAQAGLGRSGRNPRDLV